jgi:hypothetical protein
VKLLSELGSVDRWPLVPLNQNGRGRRTPIVHQRLKEEGAEQVTPSSGDELGQGRGLRPWVVREQRADSFVQRSVGRAGLSTILWIGKNLKSLFVGINDELKPTRNRATGKLASRKPARGDNENGSITELPAEPTQGEVRLAVQAADEKLFS